MKIDFYEQVFLALTVVMLVAFGAFLIYAVQAHGIDVAAPAQRIDPLQVRTTPPFDRPGIVEIAPGRYTVTMIAFTWKFDPSEIRVPAGSEVTFQIASTDVIHGFLIRDTTVNVMVIPGEVTTVTHRFDKPGEYLFACHEYCGTGHQTMSGRVVVEPAGAAGGDA